MNIVIFTHNLGNSPIALCLLLLFRNCNWVWWRYWVCWRSLWCDWLDAWRPGW